MKTPEESTRAATLPQGVWSALDVSIIREASEVLGAVGASGVALPDNWRWPLADELSGIATTPPPAELGKGEGRG